MIKFSNALYCFSQTKQFYTVRACFTFFCVLKNIKPRYLLIIRMCFGFIIAQKFEYNTQILIENLLKMRMIIILSLIIVIKNENHEKYSLICFYLYNICTSVRSRIVPSVVH